MIIQISSNTNSFVYVHSCENDICRIILSGKMVSLKNFSFNKDSPVRQGISRYLFDFSSLDMIDSNGSFILLDLILTLKKEKAQCVSFGGKEIITELLDLLGISDYLPSFPTEHEALDAFAKQQ